jgi:predicted NUDIX family phosphoesterase
MKRESILVLPRRVLESADFIPLHPGVLPLSSSHAHALEGLVTTSGLFLPRDAMEVDPTYKQIIPYMAFVYERRLFVMQRSACAGEQRLAGKYTVGIGGHVREADLVEDGLVGWGMREFFEEVAYDGHIAAATVCGLVNDDSTAVGKVHMGVVIILQGSTDRIAVRSELASGALMYREECLALLERMEPWSQYVVAMLIAHGML